MSCIWVVVKIMVPLWIPIIIRHLIFRVPNIILTTTHIYIYIYMCPLRGYIGYLYIYIYIYIYTYIYIYVRTPFKRFYRVYIYTHIQCRCLLRCRARSLGRRKSSQSKPPSVLEWHIFAVFPVTRFLCIWVRHAGLHGRPCNPKP